MLVVGGTPTLYQINLTTGAATATAGVTLLDASELVRDITIAPPASAPAQLAGDVFGLTETNKLVSFNPATPQKVCTTATFTGQQGSENIVGIDVRPADAALYALGSTGRLYTADAAGALTLKSTLTASLGDGTAPYAGMVGTEFGIDFNPGNDLLRIVSDTGQNLRVTVDNGNTITDDAVNPVGPILGAAAYSNSFVGTGTALFYAIDSTGDGLQVLGRPSGSPINGDVQTVGALGVGDVSSVGGFDILGTNNWGLAALSVDGAATSDLFNVNLDDRRGHTHRHRWRRRTIARPGVWTIAGGHGVRTDDRQSPGELQAAHAWNLRHATSRSRACRAPRSIVGMDFRPSNGALYALTDAGQMYTIDTATGAASGGVALTANTLDMTDPVHGDCGHPFRRGLQSGRQCAAHPE